MFPPEHGHGNISTLRLHLHSLQGQVYAGIHVLVSLQRLRVGKGKVMGIVMV